MSLLTSVTAVEDSVFDVVKMAEDAVLHTARTLREGFEPITKRLPERPTGGLVPAPGEIRRPYLRLRRPPGSQPSGVHRPARSAGAQRS